MNEPQIRLLVRKIKYCLKLSQSGKQTRDLLACFPWLYLTLSLSYKIPHITTTNILSRIYIDEG
jgi:hypothetical protein